MTNDVQESPTELERMAQALEQQNKLHEQEQALRQRELELQAESARATLLDTQLKAEELEIAEAANRQASELLVSCKTLQGLVRELLDAVHNALDHGEVRTLIKQIGSNIQVLVGLVASLSVAVAAVVSDGPTEDNKRELREVQNRIMDILQSSVDRDVLNIGQVASNRDTNIKGG